MRTKIFTLYLAMACFLFFGCGGAGKMNNDQVLGNVQDPQMYDTMTLLEMDDDLSMFMDLVELSGLDASLLFAEGFTVFVPTNEAFGDLDVSRFEELTDPQNLAELQQFVRWHFMPNVVYTTQLDENQVIDVEGDKHIPISTGMGNTNFTVGGATIIQPDIKTSDGIIHIVNGVLRPVDDSMRL